MAKQALVWKNIEVAKMTPEIRAAFLAYHKAHDALVAVFEADARKHKAIQNGQTIKLSIRGNVIGFAIANGSVAASVDGKSLWN